MPEAKTITICRTILRSGEWSESHGRIALSYEGRLLRRRRIVLGDGSDFHLDLPETTSLNPGDAFALSDGRVIAVDACDEALLAVSGNLPRLAWHIGNRHTPCQIEEGRLLIRHDHVLLDMLLRLGAEVSQVSGPFAPEGGAFGHGRTLPHAHGHGRAEHA